MCYNDTISTTIDSVQPKGKWGVVSKVFAWTFARRRNTALFALLCLGAMAVLLQLCYPSDRLLPFSTVDGVYIGSASKQFVLSELDNLYSEAAVEIKGRDDFSKTLTLYELGVTLDTEQEIAAYLDYPLWQRLIPFTLFNNAIPRSGSPRMAFSSENALDYSQSVDAQIVFEDGIKVVPEQVKYVYDKSALNQALEALPLNAHTQHYTLDLDIAEEHPSIGTETAQSLADTLEHNLHDGLDFVADGHQEQVHVGFEEVLKWLEPVPHAEDGSIEIAISTPSASEQLAHDLKAEGVHEQVDATVTMLNGVETGRSSGASGKAINTDDLAAALRNSILGDAGKTITLTFVDLSPRLTYKREYTGDWAGLGAELNFKYADKSVAIVVQDLSGKGHNFSLNAGRVFTSASTYKLFTALSMFRSGNVPECFEDMIVNSANACPEVFLAEYGYTRSTQDAHSIGALSTDFVHYAMVTTAADLALYLQKLYSGTLLLQPNQSDRLLSAMKRQVYRKGIPQGVGSRGYVADKVGFLDGLLHDAGIVYSDTGNYICVIMTDGQSWGEIANIARLIQDRF